MKFQCTDSQIQCHSVAQSLLLNLNCIGNSSRTLLAHIPAQGFWVGREISKFWQTPGNQVLLVYEAHFFFESGSKLLFWNHNEANLSNFKGKEKRREIAGPLRDALPKAEEDGRRLSMSHSQTMCLKRKLQNLTPSLLKLVPIVTAASRNPLSSKPKPSASEGSPAVPLGDSGACSGTVTHNNSI